ncbi:MAG: cupin domain-containing protein [Myxococcota bacterium]
MHLGEIIWRRPPRGVVQSLGIWTGSMNKQQLIDTLQLEPHIQGGYFRRTYQSSGQWEFGWGLRHSMTSIFYLLTDDSSIGHWHLNRTDIVHCFQLGQPVKYSVISPEGEFQQHVMGPDLAAGQHLQFTVPGGWWKASELTGGSYGLLSEAVSPGFDYADMNMGKEDAMLQQFPHLADEIRRYIKTDL